MLKRHKNRFLQIINNYNFSTDMFNAYEGLIGDSPSFVIELKGTPLKFIARNAADNYHEFDFKYVQFSPTFSESPYFPRNGYTGEDDVFDAFGDWLESHVKLHFDEMLEPDLWTQLESQDSIIKGTIISEDETIGFTESEKKQFMLSINEFKLLIIKNYQPDEEELKVIDNRLEYLSSSLDRLNKLDWRGLAISTLISISVALSLDTTKGKALFVLFKQVFSQALHLLH